MDKKKLKLLSQETEEFEEVEMLEENLSIESLELQNPSLVRIDMNMIEYPLFSKNNHRKKNQAVKYYFNNNRNNYIKIEPTAGDYVPGDFEEKVFIGLLKIMKRKNFSQSFHVTSSEILEELGLKNKIYYKKLKQAIMRLSKTSYEFKNTLYANKINNILDETVSTRMLDIRIIELSKDQKIKKVYNDNRIKEVYEINISKYFYENIIRKGYMVYDASILLGIESSISRTVYMLINKLRFTNLYLKLPVLYLIKRIPLKLDEKNISRTVKILEKSCGELLDNGLIKGFNVIRNKNWKDAEMEFNFNEEHNEVKQLHFFDDKNHFEAVLGKIDENLVISHTVEEPLALLKQLKTAHSEKEPTEEDIESIIEILPKKARELKTMANTVKKAIRQYGYSHIADVAAYIKEQNPKSISGYFSKTLENNWATDFIVEKKNRDSLENSAKEKKNETSAQESEGMENLEKNEIKEIKERYILLSEKEKTQIEELAFKEYSSKFRGAPKNIVEITFKNGKLSIICDYLLKTDYFHSHQEKKNPVVVEEEGIFKGEEVPEKKMTGLDRKQISKVIQETSGNFSVIYGLDEDEELELKVQVAEKIKKLEHITEKSILMIFEETIKSWD